MWVTGKVGVRGGEDRKTGGRPAFCSRTTTQLVRIRKELGNPILMERTTCPDGCCLGSLQARDPPPARQRPLGAGLQGRCRALGVSAGAAGPLRALFGNSTKAGKYSPVSATPAPLPEASRRRPRIPAEPPPWRALTGHRGCIIYIFKYVYLLCFCSCPYWVKIHWPGLRKKTT